MQNNKLRIIPLGGLGEVGKNMMAYEINDQILLVDAGLMFPDNDMLGVDYIIPDFEYLHDKSHKIVGIIITHGHEDHIGAIHHVLREIPAPIFGTPLTLGLVEVKLARNGLAGKAELRQVQAGETVQIGPFKVDFFHVSHSIPDAVGLAIGTKAGLVVHTGDYKFDHTPVDNWPTDFAKLAELSTRGVDLLLSDSTNAERPGWTPSERVIEPALDDAIRNAKGRVIIATFASLISRMQQVADASVRNKRKLAFVGTSMVDNAKMARKLGYLKVPDETLVTVEAALNLPDAQVVLMCTGSQGEPSSIIGRLSAGTNRQFDLKANDTVVLSSHPIPGNEEAVSKTINRMLRVGANVIYDSIAPVHVSGHASQEEQKLMLSLVRPKYFMPIHGELRQLKRHASLARQIGIPEERIFVAENGQVIEMEAGVVSLGERIPGGYVFVEGGAVGEMDRSLLKEREQLARAGILLINLGIDKYSNRLLEDPEIVTRGFVSAEEAETLIPAVSKRVADVIHGGGFNVEKDIVDVVRSFIFNETKRRPLVFVTMTKV
ncbi:MAG: ribonuclease J [Chloroflexi bacterium HGW-Chloroflexi-6]|nr:MAG: ribonuclease J [Chloroflexi bacterium HGW-Chloroflexi-6]